jgi:hypothetical protein
MTRQYSDGPHDDADRPAIAAREYEQREALCREARDLRQVNEWLRLQIECPWRIENYRPRTVSRQGAKADAKKPEPLPDPALRTFASLREIETSRAMAAAA